MSAERRERMPPQIKYIVGNEAAERFSYYGMAAILVLFMTRSLGFSESDAQAAFHYFVFGVYFAPLLGAYLSDRFWGKYRTIMALSLFYVLGHGILAVWENEVGLAAGLTCLALGAGGIKPCTAAHVGDQFTERNRYLLERAFPAFYFSINVGSLLAQVGIPYARRTFGFSVAFAIPAVLMALAVVVFWIGRKQYIVVPPTRRDDTPGRVFVFALGRGLPAARERFGARAVDEALAVARVSKVLLPCLAFWALFMQTGSSWVLLSEDLDLHGWLAPDSIQAFNPGFVMVLIPVFSGLIYPWASRRGFLGAPLSKMSWGMFVTGFSFVAVAILRALVDAGHQPSALWMIAPYLILSCGEVLVSIPALEFAYSQAPRSAKSSIMSLWYLTIGLGSLSTAIIADLELFSGAANFAFWAAVMFAVAVVFAVVARRYRVVDFVEPDDAAAA